MPASLLIELSMQGNCIFLTIGHFGYDRECLDLFLMAIYAVVYHSSDLSPSLR